MPPAGMVLCLASAASFGAMGVFGKVAYGEGATVSTLLSARFALAAVLLWLLVACAGGLRRLRAVVGARGVAVSAGRADV